MLDSDLVLKTSIFGIVLLFIICIVSLTIYTSTTNDVVTNNKASQDKITSIQESMRSAMGDKWPFVLLTITIFIAIILGCIYVAAQKDNISIQINDKYSQSIYITFMIFIILFTTLLIVLA